MDGRLSTGNDILDRHLSGGVPPGKIVALVAPPDSQSELLIARWVDAGPAYYLSTLRPVDALSADLEEQGVNLETTTLSYHDPENLAANLDEIREEIPENGRVILDAADSVEALPRQDQLAILNGLSSTLRERDSVGLVHCSIPTQSSGRSLTLRRADLVWRLQLAVTSLSIENRLLVTKFRGGAAMTKPIKLLLTDRVSVDTSRDIA